MDRQTKRDASNAPTGELAELLTCERELAELLEQGRQEAERTIERARSEAARAGAELEASLEEEAERERTRIRDEVRGRLREIHSATRERADVFEGVTDERVEMLADLAFRRLLSTEEGS